MNTAVTVLALLLIGAGHGLGAPLAASLQPGAEPVRGRARPGTPVEAVSGPATGQPGRDPAPAGDPAPDSAAGQLPPSSTEPAEEPASASGSGDEVVRIGSDYLLNAGDTASEVVVVMGSATVNGRVNRDLVVVLGEVHLGPGAEVGRDLVVVGGNLTAQKGAAALRDVVVVGGTIDAPPDFMPGGEQVVVGFKAVGDALRTALPWLTGGLMLARPIVPDLPWVWVVVGLLFVVYLGVLLTFDRPVALTADAMRTTPLRSILAGLVVLVLTGPIFLLLSISVVGLVAVPFALSALIVAGIVGKTATAQWIGERVFPPSEPDQRLLSARSLLIGCAALTLAYMVPVVGGAIWAVASTAGLGAAVLAFTAAYQRERPPAKPHAGSHQLSAATASPGVVPALAPPAPDEAGGTRAVAVEPTTLLMLPHATFLDRVAAFALDAILVGLAIALIEPLEDGAFVPLFLAYRSAFWAWKGATVGGIITQLRVVRTDGSMVSAGEALIRGLGSVFSIVVFGVGCLWVLRDAERQAWHDKMAGTFVVKVPRNWPL